MAIEFLLERFAEHPASEAIIWKDKAYDYGWLLEEVGKWKERIRREGIPRGAVVMIEADFSPGCVALFLALIDQKAILVPLTGSTARRKDELTEIAQGEFSVVIDSDDGVLVKRWGKTAEHKLYSDLRKTNRPGLVVFSSGSTGKSKAMVHDMAALLEKFVVRRHALRTLTFLLFDHLGGINTMLYILSNGGCMIAVQDRSPDAVLAAIARHRVELLPTSPTFMNLVLLSEAWQRHDLSSLKTVTYGTEPMPESTLRRFHSVLPEIRLLQTYGLSEVGVLRSQSKSSDSLWVRVGGEGFEIRVVGGILQIKARSAMLGYLNAPDPFTEDGWLDTGDLVEVDGEFVKFLGRKSEIINVGGEKVFPAEVESVLQEIDGVEEVVVSGEANAFTGNIVVARVRLKTSENAAAFRMRMWHHCAGRLARYKTPQKVKLVTETLTSERHKKMRRNVDGSNI